MSDTPPASLPAPDADASAADKRPPTSPSTPPAELPTGAQAQAWWRSRAWALAVLLVAGSGAVGSLLVWQKVNQMQEELARRSADAGTQATEARTLARQAQETTQELTARLATAETRLSEVSLQRSQLEELMQSVSRSRDDNLVIDLEAALRLAQQQAQLTGSAEPLLAALKTAEQRLARAAQPRLSPVQRAIVKDSERIKGATLMDLPALLLKLDELVRVMDELPVTNAVFSERPNAVPASAPAPSAAPAAPTASFWRVFDWQVVQDWSGRLLQGLRHDAASLLRVSRIDRPEAALLAPEQSYFLRENLKLKLLNARLALLSRQPETARSDLASVQGSLARYFDTSSRKTQAASALLQQVQLQLRSGELPRLDDSLAALATAAAGR